MLKKLVELFEFWSGEKLSSSTELTQAGSVKLNLKIQLFLWLYE
jgi:hypothetical protein